MCILSHTYPIQINFKTLNLIPKYVFSNYSTISIVTLSHFKSSSVSCNNHFTFNSVSWHDFQIDLWHLFIGKVQAPKPFGSQKTTFWAQVFFSPLSWSQQLTQAFRLSSMQHHGLSLMTHLPAYLTFCFLTEIIFWRVCFSDHESHLAKPSHELLKYCSNNYTCSFFL